MATQAQEFGTAPDGSTVYRVTLTHAGTTACLITWGASLQEFRISGVDHSLVLGSPEFEPYANAMRHFGAIVGPIANRVANGRAPLNGRIVELERNENGITALHGGDTGCSLSNWNLETFDDRHCTLTLTVADGARSLPGPLDLTATYSLDDHGALMLDLRGECAQPTFCNLAHHGYWNMNGTGSIAHHRLTISAEQYLPVDETKIPTGAPETVENTRFDFRVPRPVISPGDTPLDHNFCLQVGQGLRPVCTLSSERVQLNISSTEPGLQVYDGAGIDAQPGHDGMQYSAHSGIALEPQRWPDAPNHPTYPSITLMPGQTYHQTSRFHAHRVGPKD